MLKLTADKPALERHLMAKIIFFCALETGVTLVVDSANGPMTGTYRVGPWNEPQPKANMDCAEAVRSYRDDVGFYVSCDQMLVKEHDNPQDSQCLGAFLDMAMQAAIRRDITSQKPIVVLVGNLFNHR